MPGNHDWRFFPPSGPIAVSGGIKSQGFGSTWWGQRWLSVLEEDFELGSRLQRGRSYASRGQVLSIAIGEGLVNASVQGSRPHPYEVSLEVTTLRSADWKKVTSSIAGQARFAAKLLAGEMPAEIEEVFREQQLSLFPKSGKDLRTNCSCPDWSNPCKHVLAVYYLLGEEFDRDPFLIFRLRGMTREKLTQLISGTKKKEKPAPEPKEALPADATTFWQRPLKPAEARDASVPEVHAALVRRLGRFPFWSGERELADALEPVYRSASARALEKMSAIFDDKSM